jgi:ABC-type transport system substrate-binding protein
MAGGLLPPAMPGHSHNLREPLTLDQARAALAEAGYPGGEGLPPLRLAALLPMRPMLADVEDWLAELGMSVTVEWLGPGPWLSGLDCDAWLCGWVADYPDPDGFFRGLLSDRHVRLLDDDEVTRLLVEARGSRDRDRRLELYGALDRRLVEQSLLVPVFYARSVLLHRPWVHGLWANVLTPLRFDQATVKR